MRNRMHNILFERISIEPLRNSYMTCWDFYDYLGITDSENNIINQDEVKWHNEKIASRLNNVLKNDKYVLFTKFKYYLKILSNIQNCNTSVSMDGFLEALNSPITIWRSGLGIYDPDYEVYPKRKWRSFTARYNRVNAFGKHHGSTHYFLKVTHNEYWVVELTLPLNDILLYSDVGFDDEVIVTLNDAKKAKIITQI